MAVRQLKDGRWICYWVENGKQKKEYFGRGPEAEAKAWERHSELDLLKRRPSNEAYGPTFGELAGAYATARNFNKNSLELFHIRMKKTIFPVFKDKPAIKITHRALDNYVEKRRKTVKDSTIRREIVDIKAIVNWAATRIPPLIGHNPIYNYKAPAEDNEVIIPPSQEETDEIMAYAAPHLLRAITLSWYLGLRPGAVELLSLQWSYVNWESMTILVFSAHKGGPEKRAVPIHENLFNTLKSWHEEDKEKNLKYIIHYHKKPVKSIKTAWRNALTNAGIERRLRPYDLRHNMITRALEDGADIKALSEVVGSSPETLRKTYQHVSNEMKRRVIASIPAIEIPKERKKPPKKKSKKKK